MNEIEQLTHIDFDKCTEKLQDAFVKAFYQAEQFRYEFITPEQLLYQIVCQSEFMECCQQLGLDYLGLEDRLMHYNAALDKVPEDEEYIALLSNDSMRLMELLKTEMEKRTDPDGDESDGEYYVEGEEEWLACAYLNPVDVLTQIYHLEDSTAKYFLCQYLGEQVGDWKQEMCGAYLQDMQNFINRDISIPDEGDEGEEYDVGGNQDAELSSDEMFSRMMASAGRLMGALNSLNELHNGGHAADEGRRKHEPWEDLVTCINDTYMQKNPLIGRKTELARAIRILCRKDKNNPLFVGEPGVGKTAIIYGLARMVEEGDVPEWLQGQQIYEFDMGNMLAGASYHGEFEKRMKMVLDGARRRGNCIIYIDEIHNIMDAGGRESMNAAEMLKPYLEDGSVRFIGSTTYQDYNKSIAGKKAIARRFGLIDIKEPSVDETVEIVSALLPIYEKHHGVKYAKDVAHYVVEQTDALIHDRFLPDKAIDIIDETGAYLQQNPLLNKKGEPKAARYQIVDQSIARRILTEVCRIDAKALTSDSNDELKDLDKRISSEIYGQDDAVRQVVRSVMMSKAGLMEPGKPIASLLFVGPTGVGKTEVCKVLAKELGIELIRFDMSEYTEKHTVSKLIGSPAGYVGYDEGGLLTDAIRKTPNCVLLFDEIEKAHPDIYNILLQVMDYARLTDNKGNKADFRNVILVMTSNAGAQYAGQASIGFGGGQSKGQAMLASVKKTFKPEFLNRLSGTIVFNDMDERMASLILGRKLRQLSARLEAKGVTLSLSDEARAFLLQKGFTTLYGAREMDRAINRYLTPILMEEILFGTLKNGGTATITTSEDGLAIDR